MRLKKFGRERLWRMARVARLTTRRTADLAVTKGRSIGATPDRRRHLAQRYTVSSAEDVARELGQMKGVMMKLGQMASFIAEGLPPDARAALESLQSDGPSMSPALVDQVVREEFGDTPRTLFRRWDPVAIAAASVGQVHRAELHDGRAVAVKVQYPGAAEAIHADLDNADLLYRLVASFTLKGLDTAALVDELRTRMGDELDYRAEASNQTMFACHYRHHPFIRIPDVVPERSGRRVITSTWVDGWTWNEFDAAADPALRQQVAEVLFRFAQGSIHRLGSFNGDPHPGNYRFHIDGTVTFLDFGLVKRWTPSEWDALAPCIDAIIDVRRADVVVAAMETAGFLRPGHGLDPDQVYAYVATPYRPYLSERFRFDRAFVTEALQRLLDLRGEFAPVIAALDLPPSFVILDRVVWGISSLLGKLDAEGPWNAILGEYRHGTAPATDLGRADHDWWTSRNQVLGPENS